MTILISGALGWLGKRLTRLLGEIRCLAHGAQGSIMALAHRNTVRRLETR